MSFFASLLKQCFNFPFIQNVTKTISLSPTANCRIKKTQNSQRTENSFQISEVTESIIEVKMTSTVDPTAVFGANTIKTVSKIPLLKTKAGPRDANYSDRLKEELTALISYLKHNKATDTDWFSIKSNKLGTRWTGKCWYYHEKIKYEFALEFDIPVTYPVTPPELMLPELEGKTAKMYRGGKICQTIHFNPLWSKNVPHFGIAHALALGLAPWLAAEIPHLIETGAITPK